MRSAIDQKDATRVVSKIRSLGQASGPVVERAMETIAKMLLEYALELVPVDTGALYASGRLIWNRRGLRTDVYVAFGGSGFGIDYAWYVHEDLTKAHGHAFNVKHAAEIARGSTHARRPQETAKYLEIAVRTKLGAMKVALNMFVGKPTNR